MSHQPHPMNVAGDFYVEDGCCAACGLPMQIAPSLFSSLQYSNGSAECFVKKQPQNFIELQAMLETIHCADLLCIRYRGTDREIQTRLFDDGKADQCDDLLSNLQQQLDQ